MGKLWDIIEDWRDGMAYPPTYRKIAKDLDVSQSSFDTWKAPTEVPKLHNLLAISRLTGVPYRRVVDAAIEDTGLYDEKAAERAAARQAAKKGRPTTSQRGLSATLHRKVADAGKRTGAAQIESEQIAENGPESDVG